MLIGVPASARVCQGIRQVPAPASMSAMSWSVIVANRSLACMVILRCAVGAASPLRGVAWPPHQRGLSTDRREARPRAREGLDSARAAAHHGTPGPQGRATATARRAGTARPGGSGDARTRNEVPELLPRFVPDGKNARAGLDRCVVAGAVTRGRRPRPDAPGAVGRAVSVEWSSVSAVEVVLVGLVVLVVGRRRRRRRRSVRCARRWCRCGGRGRRRSSRRGSSRWR